MESIPVRGNSTTIDGTMPNETLIFFYNNIQISE
jgi:hypothetical protein